MRTGKGSFYLLAIMVFTAGLVAVAAPSRAQNQDPPAQIYVTPGTESTAKPLFLQRLFGGAGSNPGLGKTKPYDFSIQHQVRQEPQDWQELADKFNAESRARTDASLDERKKAIADMYTQVNAQLARDDQKRRQQEAAVQARLHQISQQVRKTVSYSGTTSHHTSREQRPHHTHVPRTTGANIIYNNGQPQQQLQNNHGPIFLH